MNKKFIWSVSSCAFQIEGGRNLGGRTDSIWDEFTKRNYYIPAVGKAEREINSIENAADFYHKYKTDAKIMNNAGINGFVYNMDWNRIFPKNSEYINEEGLKWHIDMFEEMVKNNIKPIPILFHWDTPLWAQIQGGWENPKIIDWFRNYAKVVFEHLGKYTDLWFVNDENSTFTLLGYLDDYLPPQRKDKNAFVKSIHYLNLATAAVKKEFILAKEKGYIKNDALLGIVHDWSPPIPYDKNDNNDIQAIEYYNKWFLNFWLDPNMLGKYPDEFYQWIKENNLKFVIKDSELDFLKKYTLDFIGWNYYRPCYISDPNKKIDPSLLKKPSESFFVDKFKLVYPSNGVRYTDWKWIIDSSQLTVGARKIAERYNNVPLMIVENGMGAFDDKSKEMIIDDYRINYLKEHIEQVLISKKEGINFIGYSLWTYCDIFSPSGGYRKDYGLISVDFNSKNKTRTPKLSYVWYKQVINSNGENLTFDIEKLKNDLSKEIDKWDFKMR
ncbi:glycoside hydrolase family 1 protein [Malacoplasma iowae]|uniref:Beta-glucosidase/6-phospho-beta-glucosidase/beta-galactosidase n=2 Tax=Malacoplasma iowae TaxID=2116 RepID=A0A084U4I7_MALIO|nr:glycoside hydrolase family 1 protein [Malacoplasma iowae]VEU61589.1 Aryl-phospho-beta-D-glucosidase BglC [Mycoplasmopsis fermentans]EGZ31685.1 glucosyl hydrolase family protein [Malacoplasma iowae 695]KFB07873.1 beta-glucosidase/6-phospho-beta-glucosidase/beta-galactosidase [Malacoplasma iowae DK-CPA]QHG89319.1 glycoside hydrolase family 1 protein [Malacoplasma iowae 695]WPL35982.1 glycoside hydrolase family 1 protein [Malacoplasma iowae]